VGRNQCHSQETGHIAGGGDLLLPSCRHYGRGWSILRQSKAFGKEPAPPVFGAAAEPTLLGTLGRGWSWRPPQQQPWEPVHTGVSWENKYLWEGATNCQVILQIIRELEHTVEVKGIFWKDLSSTMPHSLQCSSSKTKDGEGLMVQEPENSHFPEQRTKTLSLSSNVPVFYKGI